MHCFATLSLALSLVASVSAVAVPRATQPKGWATALLEPYDTYHTRYMALSCNAQHSTDFFTQCCHPLLAKQSLASRPAQCDPATATDSSDDDDLPFCDDDDDDSTTDAASATPVPVTTHAPAPATTTKAKTTAPATTHTAAATAKAAAPSPQVAAPAKNSASSTVETGGFATFFYQNGVAGACGTVHKDTDLIAAIDADRYGNTGKVSSLCGKKVQITNANNKKSVTVTIADACPTCDNGNSIDLSEGAFKNIATLDEGIVPITWEFL